MRPYVPWAFALPALPFAYLPGDWNYLTFVALVGFMAFGYWCIWPIREPISTGFAYVALGCAGVLGTAGAILLAQNGVGI